MCRPPFKLDSQRAFGELSDLFDLGGRMTGVLQHVHVVRLGLKHFCRPQPLAEHVPLCRFTSSVLECRCPLTIKLIYFHWTNPVGGSTPTNRLRITAQGWPQPVAPWWLLWYIFRFQASGEDQICPVAASHSFLLWTFAL